MSPEDLEQIRTIVTAAEQRISENVARAIDALNNVMEGLESDLSGLRNEMRSRFVHAETQFSILERRTERLDVNLQSILMQIPAITKSLNVADSNYLALSIKQADQQRAIDDLAARVAKLEREIRNPPTRN